MLPSTEKGRIAVDWWMVESQESDFEHVNFEIPVRLTLNVAEEGSLGGARHLGV